MKLLKIAEKEYSEFDSFFEETERVKLEEVAPEVIEGRADLRFRENSVEDFDTVYAEIPQKNAVFGRVLLEIIEEKGIKTNYSSTGFFVMAKKNYLYYVLKERGIKSPKTVSIPSQKAARNIEEYIEPPVLGREIEGMEESERKILETKEDIKYFTEGIEHPDSLLLFTQIPEGDKYKCMYSDGDIISLQDDTEGFEFSEDNLKYSSISNKQKKTIKKAANSIGFSVAEVMLKGEKIFDINPNPDLDLYTYVSGKDTYQAVSKCLKGD